MREDEQAINALKDCAIKVQGKGKNYKIFL